MRAHLISDKHFGMFACGVNGLRYTCYFYAGIRVFGLIKL